MKIIDRELHNAVSEGDIDRVKAALDEGADPNALNKYKEMPLHVAATKGYTQIGELLLDRQALVNGLDGDSCTPLHRLAFVGLYTEFAVLLLDRGAEVDAQDKNKTTPLFWTAARGLRDMSVILLDRGAKAHLVNNFGQTAFTAARDSIKQLLLDKRPGIIKDTIKALIQQLDSSDKTMSLRAVETLFGLGELTVAYISDRRKYFGSENTQLKIIELMGRFNDRRTIYELTSILIGYESSLNVRDGIAITEKTRSAACGALIKIGEPITDPLIDHLMTCILIKVPIIHEHALVAVPLGKIKAERAVLPLIKLLKQEDERIRSIVIEALADIGQLAVDFLVMSLKDDNPLIQQGVNEVLLKILASTINVHGLDSIVYDQKIENLRNALNDPNKWVRLCAAELMAKYDEQEASVALANLLDPNDRTMNREVRNVLNGMLMFARCPRVIEHARTPEAILSIDLRSIRNGKDGFANKSTGTTTSSVQYVPVAKFNLVR